jgi:hypothetical protein
MKSKLLFACCLIGLASSACVDDPSDDKTGIAPGEQIFKFDAETSRSFLSEELGASNALQAEFTVVGEAGARLLVPVQVAGEFPESAGADADLQGGIGFGTYPNDRSSSVWTEDAFASTLTAELVLTKPGDAIKFCRSFATTCVNVQLTAEGGLAVLTLAANVPDTEIGEIAPGVSASIRGTGADGLTIAVADPTVLARPFALTAGTPMTLEWRIARGAMEGSIKYSVSVNGTELASGDTATALASSITKLGGVAMQFAAAGEVKTEVDYSYAFGGDTGDFSDGDFGQGVNLSPQVGLTFSPLLVYPTRKPGIDLLTLGGDPTQPYSPQETDGVLGAIAAPPASGAQVTLASTVFADDFAGTDLAGAIDQTTQGGGFFPSPALCYSQIYALLLPQVQAAARKEAHRTMFARIGTGITQANAALNGAPGYTVLTPADIITIATDYADSNVDMNIATSASATYTVTLAQTVSQTFVAQLSAIVEVNPDEDLVALLTGLTTPPGVKETYDAGLALALADRINGTNVTGTYPEPNPPLLASTCVWGIPARPEVPATEAVLVLDADFTNDAPAYAAIPAQPAITPVREQAAAQINQLVMGIYGNFITQVFGPPVPASNFSMSMQVGDTAGGTAPGVRSIVITAE